MPKTVEQKLQGAKAQIREDKKKIKEQERKIYALDHQVNSLRQQRQELTEKYKISEAKIKSAEMFISYLAGRVSNDKEIEIPLQELYKFMGQYRIICDKDDTHAIIKLVQKDNELLPKDYIERLNRI